MYNVYKIDSTNHYSGISLVVAENAKEANSFIDSYKKCDINNYGDSRGYSYVEECDKLEGVFGETFKVGDLEFIVLEHTGLATNVILKNFLVISKFDPDSSNYAESRIRRQLNTVFFNKLAYAVGEKNIY